MRRLVFAKLGRPAAAFFFVAGVSCRILLEIAADERVRVFAVCFFLVFVLLWLWFDCCVGHGTKAGYAAAHIALLAVALYVDVASWNVVVGLGRFKVESVGLHAHSMPATLAVENSHNSVRRQNFAGFRKKREVEAFFTSASCV